ncbi:unnamed protein product [Leptosia nina]|uniref:Ribosomal protein L32 n=1 Tax=Leptosia nina TaxID=320188 RepID=A0AAV1JTA6_9NEOP
MLQQEVDAGALIPLVPFENELYLESRRAQTRSRAVSKFRRKKTRVAEPRWKLKCGIKVTKLEEINWKRTVNRI